MTAATMGFSPAEVSALANRPVLQEHVDEAGFLWTQRARAVDSPRHNLAQLARVDARLKAHLEGMRIGGQVALALAMQALEPVDRGGLFAASWLAFALQDRQAMRDTLRIALGEPCLMSALIAALAWHPRGSLPAMALLGRSPLPAHRRLFLAARCASRCEPELALAEAAHDPDAALRARALRAMGELGRRDLAAPLHEAARHDDDLACRFWANWSLALQGDEHAARSAFALADSPEPTALSGHGLDIAVRASDPAWARDLVRHLAATPGRLRDAVVAAGAFGDPAVVPWLLQLVEDDTVSQPAAESFALLTGISLESPQWRRDAPEEPPLAHPKDADAHWADADALRDWWRVNGHRFVPGRRYLGGQMLDASAALQVLRSGTQRQRRGAALEHARLCLGSPLFPIAACAQWQQRRLAA